VHAHDGGIPAVWKGSRQSGEIFSENRTLELIHLIGTWCGASSFGPLCVDTDEKLGK
jgi:hypothetical protein